MPSVSRCLVLGAGAFSAAKCLALDYPEAVVDAVDIESELEAIARRYFRLDRPEFAHIVFHGMASEAFLSVDRGPYDVLFDDMFDGFQHVPRRSLARAHFARMAEVLSPTGVLVKNLIWTPLNADTRAACEEAFAALQATFPHHAALALGEPERGHNRILIGMKRPPPFAWGELERRLIAAGVPEHVAEGITILASSG